MWYTRLTPPPPTHTYIKNNIHTAYFNAPLEVSKRGEGLGPCWVMQSIDDPGEFYVGGLYGGIFLHVESLFLFFLGGY